ncbi:MAG: alpha/beta fold hydrolase [Pyrinomonadaceae bacterium]
METNVKVLAHCHWQDDFRRRPTAVLVHGLEGSSSSVYMISTAQLFFQAGYNVLRYNMRNCGGTEHLTPTLYHSGMSGDLQAVVRELIERDQLTDLFVIGYSMGGNVALKLAGEYGGAAPRELRGVCAVSPALDLSACAEAINRRSNWIYQRSFLKGLRRRVRHKERLYPEIYSFDDFRAVRSIRDFDEVYTARHAGFTSADDYYERSSALKVLGHIEIPTLIIHAQDDPFIPYESFRHLPSLDNSSLILLTSQRGGHVGFVADNAHERFWAENRALDFCRLLAASEGGSEG